MKGMSAELLFEFDHLLWEGLHERTGWNGYDDVSQRNEFMEFVNAKYSI